MRTLRYEVLPGVGAEPILAEGTIVDLLFEIPYLTWPNLPLPSNDDLNCLLASGIRHAGMSGGCRWEPFVLSSREYHEVMNAIRAEKRLRERQPQLKRSDNTAESASARPVAED